MDWFKLDIVLSKVLLSQLKNLIETSSLDDYYRHSSSLSQKKTNLHFLFSDRLNELTKSLVNNFLVRPHRVAIIKVESNCVVDWHTDSKLYGRPSVVIFPLIPSGSHYSSCEVKNLGPIPKMDCYVFNTLSCHRVVNNRHTRYSLQLFFNQSIDELYEYHRKNNLFVIN